MAELVKRIQFGGDEVVKAKDGAGSATLSMAYGSFFFSSLAPFGQVI
jgi:malate dehydrogenase